MSNIEVLSGVMGGHLVAVLPFITQTSDSSDELFFQERKKGKIKEGKMQSFVRDS